MKSVNDSQEDSLLLIAAEASSCMYAKNFIKAWREKFPKTHFYGVGDREMQSLGMECVGLAEDMAVMGLLEVLKHYPAIKKVGDEIIEKTQKRPPRFALLLDYPGFNLRLAKKLKELNVSVVYYISPQLWAWKKGRVQQVRDYVDDMLVVFPFEVEFYKEHNIEAHFVGHPPR
jgi:lipid-A-disaccharide synthase